MTYICIQSIKSAFLKVLEILNLQVSVEGQISGNHCYKQRFQFIFTVRERATAVIYTRSLQAYPDISYQIARSLVWANVYFFWAENWHAQLLPPSEQHGFEVIIKGRHLITKGPLSHLHISCLCQWEFLMGLQGVTYSLGYNIKWYISWVLATEITQFMIWLLGVQAPHSLSKHCWRFIELKSCLDKYRSPS